MNGYSVEVTRSTKELTAKQRIAIKDFSNATALDEATETSPLVVDYDYHAICKVHNEHSDNPDYMKCVVVDKAGNKFVTGSESFITSLEGILDEMKDSDEEFQIEAYKKDSKNYKGKQFLTCSIL